MLDEQKLRTEFGGRLHFYDSLGSTNDRAAELAEAGVATGSLVVAREQTEGRGRRGRKWESGQDITLSLVLRPDELSPEAAPGIGLVGALGVVEALTELGITGSVKWPNDVLIDNQKVAGVLAEATWSGSQLDYVVVGVGVNVESIEFQETPDFPVTWVTEWAAVEINRLLVDVVKGVESWFERLLQGTAHPKWEDYLAYREEPVKVQGRGETVDGVLSGLTPFGGLRLRQDGDKEVVLQAGDYSLRPATLSSRGV